MEILLDVSQYMTWYFLLGIGIITLSLVATLKHKNFMPLSWGLILTIAIWWYRNQIAPLVFGVMNYEWATNPVMYFLTGVFAIMFFAYIALTLWNLYHHEKVIA